MISRIIAVLSILVIVAIGAFGCSSDSPTASDMPGVASTDKVIPADADIQSARLFFRVTETDRQTITLHAVTTNWQEASVTWTNFAEGYSAGTLRTMTFVVPGWYAVDVTAQVNSWFEGSSDNYGFYLRYREIGSVWSTIVASEAAANQPYLQVCYTSPDGSGCVDIDAHSDATVSSAEPNVNFGSASNLNVGGSTSIDSTFGALIKFELSANDVSYGAIGGVVFEDDNVNLLHDAGEADMSGITVNLYECDQAYLQSTTTAADGGYHFDSLEAGSYVIGFEAPEGYEFSAPPNGVTACLEVVAGEEILSVNAGLVTADPGCTHGKGYWMNHAGFGPQANKVIALVPIWLGDEDGLKSILVTDVKTAYDLLKQKKDARSNNGISMLYAHLLTVKLNIANRADPTDIADVIAEVDAFLADHNWEDWDTLESEKKQLIKKWHENLENYNEGVIGPGKCDDGDAETDTTG